MALWIFFIEEAVCENGRRIEEGVIDKELQTKVDIESSDFAECLKMVKKDYPKANGAFLDTDAWEPECYALTGAIKIESSPLSTSYGCIFKGTIFGNIWYRFVYIKRARPCFCKSVCKCNYFVGASQEKQKKEVENELLRKVSQGDAVKENDTDSRDFVDYVEDFVDFVEGGKKNAIRTSNNNTNISKTSGKLIMKGTQKLSSKKWKIIKNTCSI